MNEDMGKHGIVQSVREQFKTVKHKADVCVVGAGLAGMCAAIAAAHKSSRSQFSAMNIRTFIFLISFILFI